MLDALHQSGAADVIGNANVFELKNEAIAAIYQRLDLEICGRCQARIFLECNRGEFLSCYFVDLPPFFPGGFFCDMRCPTPP